MDFFCNSSYWGIKLLAGGPDLTRGSLLDLGSAHKWVSGLAPCPEVTADQERGQVLFTSGLWDPHKLPDRPPTYGWTNGDARAVRWKIPRPRWAPSPANEHVDGEMTHCDSRWVRQHGSDVRSFTGAAGSLGVCSHFEQHQTTNCDCKSGLYLRSQPWLVLRKNSKVRDQKIYDSCSGKFVLHI